MAKKIEAQKVKIDREFDSNDEFSSNESEDEDLIEEEI